MPNPSRVPELRVPYPPTASKDPAEIDRRIRRMAAQTARHDTRRRETINGLVDNDPWHNFGDPGEPALDANWSVSLAFPGDHETLGFRLRAQDVLELKGTMARTPNSSLFLEVLGTLPVGRRPQKTREFTVQRVAGFSALIGIYKSGAIVWQSASGLTCNQTTFDGIHFHLTKPEA